MGLLREFETAWHGDDRPAWRLACCREPDPLPARPTADNARGVSPRASSRCKAPMTFHRFEKIGGAGRMKTAARRWSTEPGKQRRNRPLVDADEKTNEQNHRQGRRIGAPPPRRNRALLFSPRARSPDRNRARVFRRDVLLHVQGGKRSLLLSITSRLRGRAVTS